MVLLDTRALPESVSMVLFVALLALAMATPSSLPCRAVPNCSNCSNTNTSQCGICGNSWYLLEGTCVGSCPATGYNATGTGRFNRVCAKNYPCTSLRDSCLTCSTDRLACAACAHSKYLVRGKCEVSCPAGFLPRGTGRFNRVCIAQPSTPCQALKNGCFMCDPTNTRCLTCTRGKAVFEGQCIERLACPIATHRVRGAGQFRLRCLPHNITANTACQQASCFVCPTSPSTCEDCVPPRVLHNGQCVTSCPSNAIRMPGFGASAVCVSAPPLPATCVAGANNCLRCGDADNACALCDTTNVLFQGACLDTCPPGTLLSVTAALGRHCT